MARVTDEMLVAYADGELSKKDAELVEQVLREGDTECRDAIDAFRRTAILARAAFAADATEPIPDALVRTVLGTGDEGRPVDFNRRRRRRLAVLDRYATAMAACLAVVFVAAGLMLALRPSERVTAGRLDLGPVPSGSPLAHVLATVPASTPVAAETSGADGASKLMVVSTFYDRTDRICREIELMDASLTPHRVAVACRARDGDSWSIEGAAQIAVAQDAPSPDYAPAGAAEKDALQSLRKMLGAKDALPPDEERRLIDSGRK